MGTRCRDAYEENWRIPAKFIGITSATAQPPAPLENMNPTRSQQSDKLGAIHQWSFYAYIPPSALKTCCDQPPLLHTEDTQTQTRGSQKALQWEGCQLEGKCDLQYQTWCKDILLKLIYCKLKWWGEILLYISKPLIQRIRKTEQGRGRGRHSSWDSLPQILWVRYRNREEIVCALVWMLSYKMHLIRLIVKTKKNKEPVWLELSSHPVVRRNKEWRMTGPGGTWEGTLMDQNLPSEFTGYTKGD